MTDSARGAALVSNVIGGPSNLFWNGTNGVAGNAGTKPTIFAPNPYKPGSSISHLDESVHGAELMSPSYSGPDHIPSAIEIGMLADMGWNMSGSGDSSSLTVFGPGFSQLNDDRRDVNSTTIPFVDSQFWTVDLTSPTFKTSAVKRPSGIRERSASQIPTVHENSFIAGWFAAQPHRAASELSQRAETANQFTTVRNLDHNRFSEVFLTTSRSLNDHPDTHAGKQELSTISTRLSEIDRELHKELEMVDESPNERALEMEQLDNFFTSIVDYQETRFLLPF
jgi:hypothetical protein